MTAALEPDRAGSNTLAAGPVGGETSPSQWYRQLVTVRHLVFLARPGVRRLDRATVGRGTSSEAGPCVVPPPRRAQPDWLHESAGRAALMEDWVRPGLRVPSSAMTLDFPFKNLH